MKIKIIFSMGIIFWATMVFGPEGFSFEPQDLSPRDSSIRRELNAQERRIIQAQSGTKKSCLQKITWKDSSILEEYDQENARRNKEISVESELDRLSSVSEESSQEESAVELDLEREAQSYPSPERPAPPMANSPAQSPRYSQENSYWDNPHDFKDFKRTKDEDSAKEPEEFKEGPRKSFYSQTGLKAGYRNDYLRWNIAGDSSGEDPNILSELTWEDLHIFQIKGDSQLVFKDIFRLEGLIDYGWIMHGKNQDSDYNADDRGAEYSRSNNATNDDNVFDVSLGAGFQFELNPGYSEEFQLNRLRVAFLGGYSYHEQNLRMTDGNQTIPASGSFAGLNSTYQTEWDGPWMGIELLGIKDRLEGLLRMEYHWFDYYAEADWNLRSDFKHPKSYEHISDGTGISFLANGRYRIDERWSFDCDVDVKSWKAGHGMDRTFFSNGSKSETRLNEVIWVSYALMGGFTYHFSR